jgi:hypothetical protein
LLGSWSGTVPRACGAGAGSRASSEPRPNMSSRASRAVRRGSRTRWPRAAVATGSAVIRLWASGRTSASGVAGRWTASGWCGCWRPWQRALPNAAASAGPGRGSPPSYVAFAGKGERVPQADEACPGRSTRGTDGGRPRHALARGTAPGDDRLVARRMAFGVAGLDTPGRLRDPHRRARVRRHDVCDRRDARGSRRRARAHPRRRAGRAGGDLVAVAGRSPGGSSG